MGSCITPFSVKNKITNDTIPVPCNKCPECLKRRISGWSFRLLQEDKNAISSQFITLTYDTKHVPITRNGFMSLNKRDVQLFIKRLRKSHTSYYLDKPELQNEPIKYYAVGEYGGKTLRPHYHIIIFNARIELIQGAWSIDGKGIGQVHYGQVSGASVGYTLKYITKPGKIPMHRNDDRLREFALMSKGLGESYLTNAMLRWHHADPNNRMYCNIGEGKKIAMPRYYKEKIYVETERKAIGYHTRQQQVKRQREAERKGGETYWRDKAEADKAAFNKMYHNSEKNRNKV